MRSIQHLQQALLYMEAHLLEEISYEEIAQSAYMSSYDFHRMFRFTVGMSASEYIRSRRLSLAGQALQSTPISVLEAAYCYGYDTPESFSKAFTRFHGVSPKQAKRKGCELVLFNPLAIKITLEGGNIMNYRIENGKKQQFIAMKKAFANEIISDDHDHSIPDFWDECRQNGVLQTLRKLRPDGKKDLYGLCGSSHCESQFDYGIGVLIDEMTDMDAITSLLASGYSLWKTKAIDYAVFKCYGTSGDCIGDVWEKFFKEFSPQTGYQQTEDTDFELYFEQGEENLFCELWIPVTNKNE